MNSTARTMHTHSAIFFVLPTETLRQLVMRNRHRLLPGCNYTMTWRDLKGFGIELAVCK